MRRPRDHPGGRTLGTHSPSWRSFRGLWPRPCAVGANGRARGQPVILGLPLFLSAYRVPQRPVASLRQAYKLIDMALDG